MLFSPEMLVFVVLFGVVSVVHFGLRSRTLSVALVRRKLFTPLKITSTSTGWLCLDGRHVRVSYQKSDRSDDPEVITVYLESRNKPLTLTFMNNNIVRVAAGEKLLYAPGFGSLSAYDHLHVSSIRQIVRDATKLAPPVHGNNFAA